MFNLNWLWDVPLIPIIKKNTNEIQIYMNLKFRKRIQLEIER